MASKKTSKKIQDIFLDDAYGILSKLRYGTSSPLYLRKELGIESKQDLNYYLRKYVKEGILKKLGKGSYVMTESYKKIYDLYEHYKNKQLVRVENMKVSFFVQSGIKELESSSIWKKHEINNDVKIYHSVIKTHSVRLIVGKSEPKLEVTITNSLGVDPCEAYHNAMLHAYRVVNYLCDYFDVEFSEGFCTGKPEIAIPSPIASSLLQTTGASQIRTDNSIMNRSKGRGADWEVHTLQEAQKIVNMPNTLERIERKLEQLETEFALNKTILSKLASATSWSTR